MINNLDGPKYVWYRVKAPPKFEKNMKKVNYSVEVTESEEANLTQNKNNFTAIERLIENRVRFMVKAADSYLTQDTNFRNYVISLLTLFIAYNAITFLVGIQQMTQFEFVLSLLKIGVVLYVVLPSSSFGVNHVSFNFLYDMCFTAMKFLTEGILGKNYYNPWIFLDNTLGTLFSGSTWARLLSMLAWPTLRPLGLLGLVFNFFLFILFLAIMLRSIVFFILTALKVFLLYILALLFLGLLLFMGPIFVTFLLFKETKTMFDSWTRQLFRYTFEPAFLTIGFLILAQMPNAILYEMIYFPVCWKKMAVIDAKIFRIPIYWFAPWGFDEADDSTDIPVSIQRTGIDFTVVGTCQSNPNSPECVKMPNGDYFLKPASQDSNWLASEIRAIGYHFRMIILFFLYYMFTEMLKRFVENIGMLINRLTGSQMLSGKGISGMADALVTQGLQKGYENAEDFVTGKESDKDKEDNKDRDGEKNDKSLSVSDKKKDDGGGSAPRNDTK